MEKRKYTIPLLDITKGKEVGGYIDTLTKPPGSLGRLEKLAIQLAEMTANSFPSVTPPGVLVFAADHGITKEGVSAFPQEVTGQMVKNFLNGGAAINVFSKQIGALFEIIDVGVAENIEGEKLIKEKIRFGTANFLKEDALTRNEVDKAIEVGYREAKKVINKGIKCLIVGEMGIGNTTTSSAILTSITGKDITTLVGQGTGISSDKVVYKQEVIKKGLSFRNPNPTNPYDLLTKLGGLEIASMAGAMLASAEERIPILLDGFICTVAAVLADMIAPGCKHYMIAGHQSIEPGHKIAMDLLDKEPLLNLDFRLGEGSGAAIAFPILHSSTLMLKDMATFSSAGISNKG